MTNEGLIKQARFYLELKVEIVEKTILIVDLPCNAGIIFQIVCVRVFKIEWKYYYKKWKFLKTSDGLLFQFFGVYSTLYYSSLL